MKLYGALGPLFWPRLRGCGARMEARQTALGEHAWKVGARRLFKNHWSRLFVLLTGQQLVISDSGLGKKTSLQLGLLTGSADPFPYVASLNLVAFGERRE